jgi:hypothetical protein
MRKTLSLFLTFAAAMLAAFAGGCMDPDDTVKNTMSDTPIILSLNEPGASFHNRYPDLVRVTSQPAGLSFYEVRWDHRRKGMVKIIVGNRSLHASDLMFVLGTQEDRLTSEGISTVTIASAISGSDGITHEAARDFVFSALSRLRNDGWKTSIPFSSPRLRGKHMLEYKLLTGSVTPLDPDYKPALEEWIKLDNLSAWELYTDGAFLRVSFQRSPNPKDPTGPGVYLVNYELNSSINHFKGFVDPRRRDEWKTLLPAELKEITARRLTTEAALRTKGIPIDTDYVDPPIPE